MTVRVVAVHGIGNYRPVPAGEAAAALGARLSEALTEGLRRVAGRGGVDGRRVDGRGGVDLRAVYYAHLLRDDTVQAGPDDLLSEGEQRIVDSLAEALGIPEEVTQGHLALPLRLVADWVAGRVASEDTGLRRRVTRLLSNFVREVAGYLDRADWRAAVRAATAEVIAEHRPHAVVAHSLGSVVTYETLWAHRADVPLLVTVGSPLALPAAVFDRLEPLPVPVPGGRGGRGCRPHGVARWVNVADVGDVVAVPRLLHRYFDGLDRADDHETAIGALAVHGFARYLGNARTASAVATLRGPGG